VLSRPCTGCTSLPLTGTQQAYVLVLRPRKWTSNPCMEAPRSVDYRAVTLHPPVCDVSSPMANLLCAMHGADGLFNAVTNRQDRVASYLQRLRLRAVHHRARTQTSSHLRMFACTGTSRPPFRRCRPMYRETLGWSTCQQHSIHRWKVLINTWAIDAQCTQPVST
jgi:hypothetical protein